MYAERNVSFHQNQLRVWKDHGDKIKVPESVVVKVLNNQQQIVEQIIRKRARLV